MEKQEKLSGRVICRGKVEGFARIIREYGDLENVEEGEIMVASQTDMNYTPYLQKCVGLITETGGRYCHAAIYSRENNIPCITNVKEAKEKLNHSSVIVLDADRNEIYPIER